MLKQVVVLGLTLGGLWSAQGQAQAEWRGFTLTGDDGDESYALTLQGRLQARFEWIEVAGDDDEARFSISRARIGVKGHVLSKALTYKFQADFGKGEVSLKDYYVDYAFAEELQLRIGQWKRPFSRQQLTSSGSQQLVDRAITDKAFGAGRDIGLMLHANGEKSLAGLEWALGLFNGTGDKSTLSGTVIVDPATGEGTITRASSTNVPARFQPALALRLGWNTGDSKGEGYSEADFHPDKGLRAGVAASAIYDFGGDDGATGLVAELDYFLKVAGFATTGGLYLASKLGDGGLDKLGFHVQAGYLIAGWIEPSLRVARIMPEAAAVPDSGEYTLCASVYFDAHQWNWKTDLSLLTSEGDEGESHWMLRTQALLAF